MANVPTVTAPTVTQSGAPLGINAPAGAFGASTVGAGLEDFGRAFGQHADMLAQHALKMADEDAHMAAAQAADVFNVKANDVQTALFNQQGTHAREALPGALKSLADMRESVASTLTNPAARNLFTVDALNSSRYFESAMAGHAGTEWRQAVNASANATLVNKVELAVKAFGTPTEEGVRASLIDHVMYMNDQLQGGDAATFESAYRKVNQSVLAGVAENLVTVSPQKAEAFVDAHRDELGEKYAPLKLRLQPAVEADQLAAGAESVVNSVLGPMGGGVAITPSGGSRAARNNNPLNLTNRATGVSWQGQVGSDGRFAKFSSPEAGFAAADQNLQAYGTHHGIDTLAGVIQRWAPSSENDTRAYVNTVARDTGITPNAKINLNDPRTRRVILASMAKVEGGPGTSVQPTVDPGASVDSATGGPLTSVQINARQADMEATAAAQAEQMRPGDASFARKMVGEARATLRSRAGDAQATEHETWSAFQQTIESGHITDLKTLLTTVPGGAGLWNTLPVGTQINIQNQLTHNANEMTPEREDRYMELYGEARLHPEQFLQRDLRQEDLPPARIQALRQEQVQIQAKSAKVTEQQTHINSLLGNEFVKQAMFDSGVTDKNSSSYKQFTGALLGSVESWQVANPGKKIDNKTLGSLAAGLLARPQVPSINYIPTPFGDINLGPGKPIAGDLNITPPQAFHDSFVTAYTNRYGHPPADWEIGYAYQVHHGR